MKLEKLFYKVINKLYCFEGKTKSDIAGNVANVGLHSRCFIKTIVKMKPLWERLVSAKAVPSRMVSVLTAVVKMRKRNCISCPLPV